MKKLSLISITLVIVSLLCLPVLAQQTGSAGACVAKWNAGDSAETIEWRLTEKESGVYIQLMDEALLKKLPCRVEQTPCADLEGCTWEDLQVLCTKNEELATFAFRQTSGNIEMQITLTAKAKSAPLPQVVEGQIYMRGDGLHISRGIPFRIVVGATEPASQMDMLVWILTGVIGVLVVTIGIVAVLTFKKNKKAKD